MANQGLVTQTTGQNTVARPLSVNHDRRLVDRCAKKLEPRPSKQGSTVRAVSRVGVQTYRPSVADLRDWLIYRPVND